MSEFKINHVTHEPEVPVNWPEGHVEVVSVFDDPVSECLKIRIHDSEHYLHRTTALALARQLGDYFDQLSARDKAPLRMSMGLGDGQHTFKL